MTPAERETLTWSDFGIASRLLAQSIADDGFRPDLILATPAGGCSRPVRSATPWT
jgi:hypoxanthine phosphoribosyltransferase